MGFTNHDPPLASSGASSATIYCWPRFGFLDHNLCWLQSTIGHVVGFVSHDPPFTSSWSLSTMTHHLPRWPRLALVTILHWPRWGLSLPLSTIGLILASLASIPIGRDPSSAPLWAWLPIFAIHDPALALFWPPSPQSMLATIRHRPCHGLCWPQPASGLDGQNLCWLLFNIGLIVA
jgi:hypothetical protein